MTGRTAQAEHRRQNWTGGTGQAEGRTKLSGQDRQIKNELECVKTEGFLLMSPSSYFKGTVPPDFSPLFFFLQTTSPGPTRQA
jgi:hypothetical protein